MTNLVMPAFEPDPNAAYWVGPILEWLSGAGSDGDLQNSLRSPAEPHWSLELCEGVIDFLKKNPQPFKVDSSSANQGESEPTNQRLRLLLPKLSEWQLRLLFEAAANDEESTDLIVAEQSARLYQSLYSRNIASCEGGILQCLSWNRNPHGIRLLVELLVQFPPHDWSATALAISPLMRSKLWNVDLVFPRGLDAINHPSVIAPMLDLANYATRSGLTQVHPATEQKGKLLSLLGGVVERMGVLEEDPARFGKTVAEIQHVLGESVALSVSLCDAVAWIGDPNAIGKLNQAMELRHRRIQTEAAAALARMGDPVGKQSLIRFASDPATRLRVLQYSQELGIDEEVSEEWKTPAAIAESELAIWLSQTPQMSLPPTDMELLCQRTCFWPGYDEPQDCFLFRYSYRFPDCEFSNIGMAGPMVHSFAADLGDLPEDDIFAAFAGWCAEHDDIYEVESQHFNQAQRGEAKRFIDHFVDEGYSNITPLFMGFFVGERALVVQGMRDDVPGIGVTDGLELLWIPSERTSRPLRAEDLYCIFKGRKILRTFNP